jgi:hypothetical protein
MPPVMMELRRKPGQLRQSAISVQNLAGTRGYVVQMRRNLIGKRRNLVRKGSDSWAGQADQQGKDCRSYEHGFESYHPMKTRSRAMVSSEKPATNRDLSSQIKI